MKRVLNCKKFSFTDYLDAWEALTVFVNRNNIAQSDIQYISEIINGSVRLLWWTKE